MLKNNKLLMILAVTMLLIGIACGVAQYFLGGYFYRVAIEDATGIQGADKLQTLLHAIRLQPRRVAAYRLLLDELQEDGEVTQEEYTALCEALEVQGKASRQPQGILDIDADIMMCCISHTGNGNFILGLKSATPFVQQYKAGKSKDQNLIYASCVSISDFYQKHIWTGMPSSLTDQEVDSMLDMILLACTQVQIEKEVTAYDRLVYSVLVVQMMMDQRNTIAVNCSYKEAKAVLDSIYNSLPDMTEYEKETDRQLYEKLVNNEQSYRDLLARAFGEGEG